MQIDYSFVGESIPLNAVRNSDDSINVTLPNGTVVQAQMKQLEDGLSAITIGIRTINVAIQRTKDTVHICYNGKVFHFARGSNAIKSVAKQSNGEIVAPMTGVLTSVMVTQGQTVSAFQPLAVMEAMKVIATLESPFEGTVHSIQAKAGDQVSHGQLIVVVKPAEPQ